MDPDSLWMGRPAGMGPSVHSSQDSESSRRAPKHGQETASLLLYAATAAFCVLFLIQAKESFLNICLLLTIEENNNSPSQGASRLL